MSHARVRAAVRVRGISLIEMLLCVGLLSVLVTQGVSSFAGMLDRARINVAVGALRTAIMVARMQAMQRAQRIDIVPLAADDWGRGWVVLVDANNNQRADPGETVIHPGFRPATPLKVVASLTDNKRAYLAFGAGGRPRTAGSAAQPQFGSFTFRHGSEQRRLVLGFLGRVRSCDPVRDGAAC